MLEPEDNENDLFLPDPPDLKGEDYPYWRDNGATSILSETLDDIAKTLTMLIEDGRILVKELEAHITEENYLYCLEVYGNTPDGGKDPRAKFWTLELRLERVARTAIVMAVIDLEARVNKFCFYNLGVASTEAIENLQPLGKLEVIHKVLGLTDFKGTAQYAAMRSLVRWRNAFVHGKCTDMPANSIKENHTVFPKKSLSSMDIVSEALEHLRYYCVMYSHLNKISKHPYTSEDSTFDRFDYEPIKKSGSNKAYFVHLVPLEETLRRIKAQFNNARALIKEIDDLMGYEQSTS